MTFDKQHSRISAVILAGGLGTRLRSVVADRPKVLAPIHGRPFLSYLLDQLVEAGFTRVVLCTGYMADQVRQTFGTAYGPLSVAYSAEEAPLGTAGALKNAEGLVDSERVLVMNGDSYCDVDVGFFCDWHDRSRASGSIVLVEISEANRYGSVQRDSDDRITRFDEKSAGSSAGWINAGIYLLHRDLVRSIPGGCSMSLEREMFPQWLTKGQLFGYPCKGFFIDIGMPQDLMRAETLIPHRHRAVEGQGEGL